MKKPNLKTIPSVNTKPTAKVASVESKKVRKSDDEKVVKKSFSILPDQNAFIEKFALEEGVKRGKSMNASEALRMIIDKARGE